MNEVNWRQSEICIVINDKSRITSYGTAKHLSWDDLFHYKLSFSLLMKKILKSMNVWRSFGQNSGIVWYGMVNVDLYSAIITKESNALDMLVSGEKPGFQTLSEGLVVLLCAEVVRQRVPDHGAVHSECSASDSG